ncbi:MAG: retropepsin-like aspartic protease [Acidobacteriaceae bacterium]
MLRVFALSLCLLATATLFGFSPASSAQTYTISTPQHAPTSAAPDLYTEAITLHYDDLARDLSKLPPGPEHDLFAGVLADSTSRFDESIRLLTPISIATDMPRNLMALALGSLADDYVKTFHYREASALYQRLLDSYADVLSPELRRDDQDDSETLKLLINAPPQTIDIPSPIDLHTHSDPLGSITADLTAHNITAPWILDTGANFSAISESFAHQLGLTLLPGTAHTQGATGAENPLHIALLDTLTIGSATLHNVVLLVLPDANLTIQRGRKHYVIPAALGYPVFQALSIIRFTHDHHFQAGPTLPLTGDSAPIYMQKLNVLFSCTTHNLQRTFLFDSGANESTFFVLYYHDFLIDFLHQTEGTRQGYGVGGTSSDPVYILDHVDLELANRIADLNHIAVLKAPQHTLSDEYEGSLGRDLINAFDSLTLDLTHDRVYPGRPRN